MANDSLLDTFFEECDELIEALTENLEIVSEGSWDSETINAIFRAIHSIKGAAGAFGFENLVSFAHHYETTLDQIRAGKLDISNDVLKLIIRCADNLAQLVDCARDDSAPLPTATEGLIKELMGLSGAPALPSPGSSEEVEFSFEPIAALPIAIDLGDPEEQVLEIHFKPTKALYFSGHDPLKLIAALSEHGDFSVTCKTENLPSLEDFDFDESYLEWLIRLETTSDIQTIEDVFEFVRGSCTINVEVEEAEDGPDLQLGSVQEDVVPNNTATNQDTSVLETTKTPTNSQPKAKQKVQASLRVDPERVDRLINSVGELIINHAVFDRHLREVGLTMGTDLSAALDDYGNLAREIQEGVMAIRSQQVKPLFQRMGRVAREAGDMTGKKVNYVTEGETVEIDKTILERMADPLTHMLRNAVDHGIEPPEKRLEFGKSEVGTVKLSAAHRSGHVVIEISDDGAGLDRQKLFQKGVEKGIVAPDAKLTESETYALLFAPGFSTAENVTNLSGRGVGMDVVKTSITSLGGKVTISSKMGEGSVFTISLPLTLAVLDGMIVDIGYDTMVIPLASIIETIRPNESEIHEVAPNEKVLCVRGEYAPIIDLGDLMGTPRSQRAKNTGTYILTETNGTISAISVDGIQDQRQVVIKSLKGNYGSIEGVAAATILGDGNIALIVDPEALGTLSSQRKPHSQETRMEV